MPTMPLLRKVNSMASNPDGMMSPRATPRATEQREQKKPRTSEESRIKVVIRKRPLSKKESEGSSACDILEPLPVEAGAPACLLVHEPKVKVDLTRYTEEHRFLYDALFDEESSNEAVYRDTAAPLINRIFQSGQSSTCFAYGATGAGKTHTMMGTDGEPGLYFLAARDMFRLLSQPEHESMQLYLASFEIYGGKVFDLLSGTPETRVPLPIREDGKKKMNVVGLSEQVVPSMEDFRALVLQASDARRTAATLANADSSRSHAILQLVVKRPPPKEEARNGSRHRFTNAEPAPPPEVGRFAFIDLAGTERGADTLNCENKDRRLEGAEINKSLLALKECIRGLDLGKTHIPFRGSKLTEVLRDSFIGDCHTVRVLHPICALQSYTSLLPGGLPHSVCGDGGRPTRPSTQEPLSARTDPPASLVPACTPGRAATAVPVPLAHSEVGRGM